MPCFAATRKESTGIQMQMPTTHNTNANNTQTQMKTTGKSWTGKFPPPAIYEPEGKKMEGSCPKGLAAIQIQICQRTRLQIYVNSQKHA